MPLRSLLSVALSCFSGKITILYWITNRNSTGWRKVWKSYFHHCFCNGKFQLRPTGTGIYFSNWLKGKLAGLRCVCAVFRFSVEHFRENVWKLSRFWNKPVDEFVIIANGEKQMRLWTQRWKCPSMSGLKDVSRAAERRPENVGRERRCDEWPPIGS